MQRSLCVLFALLSLTDLAMTRWLIGSSDRQVHEANPIAKWCLESHGWAGMVCYKCAVVLLVLGLSTVVFRYRPRAASGILAFGCACLALVVCYSTALCRTPPGAADDEETRQRLESMNNETRAWNDQRSAMLALLHELRQELLVESCTLREAVDRLAKSDDGKVPGVLHAQTRLYPDRPVAQGIAAFIISHTVSTVKHEPHTAAQLALRLVREFEHTYGSAIPDMLADYLEGIDREAVRAQIGKDI
jgi:hypothetical protein